MYLCIVFSFLFSFSALRGLSVGTDTFQYVNGVTRISKAELSIEWLTEQKAPLYYLLMKIGIQFLPPLQTYQIVSSIIIEGAFAFFFFSCSKNCPLSTNVIQ